LRKAFPRRASAASLAVATVAAALVAAGCGNDQSGGGKVPGDTLTVFSSLPTQGPQAARSQSILNAEKLAFEQAGGKAGEFKVNFSFLDDARSGGDRAGWDPDVVAENARKAVENLRTIAYIGELDSGATAVSIPITNEAGFAQISPGATAVGLTKLVPGAEKGEPDKFYPSGERNFARVVPADDVEASAAATWTRRLGARSAFVLGDKSVEGDGLADLFTAAAGKAGVRIVGDDRMDPRARDYRELAAKIAKARPDAVFFGGDAQSNAVRLWSDLHGALPDALLVGSDDLLVPDFYRRLGKAAGSTYLTSVAQDPSQLPARGQRFLRDYRQAYHSAPDPYAAYGYTAITLLFDAIRRAGGAADDRNRVIREIFDTDNLPSAIGTFSIDDNGDTSLRQLAGYRIRSGKPAFAARLTGTPPG